MNVDSTFWSNVLQKEDDECWEWNALTNAGGYGWVWWEGRCHLAHRIAWRLTHGKFDEKLCVLHKCDNPPCVNPKHLWLGTRQDNNRDKVEKGRAHRMPGMKNGRARLTRDQVLELRKRWRDGATIKELEEETAIPGPTLHHAVSGRTWSHLPGAMKKTSAS